MSKRKDIAKLLRRQQQRYINDLLSNMSFTDRIRFVFTGNYYKPLMRTQGKLTRKV